MNIHSEFKAERENYLQEDVGNWNSNLIGSHARTSEGALVNNIQ